MAHSIVLRKFAVRMLGIAILLVVALAAAGPAALAAETGNGTPQPAVSGQQPDAEKPNEPPSTAAADTNQDGPPRATGRVPGGGQVVTLSGLLTSADKPGEPPYLTYKTPFEFFLTALTAGIGIFLVLVLAWMARKTGITEEFVRAFMVVTIVFGALFLVVAGYSDEQTAPVFGLLGTIIGYIFGRYQSAATKPDDGGPPPPPPGDGGIKPDPQPVGPKPNPAAT